MKKYLKKEHRSTIATSYDLRSKIGLDIFCHERTIQRWATNNSPKLATKHFLDSFKKHTGIKVKNEELVETVEAESTHLHVA